MDNKAISDLSVVSMGMGGGAGGGGAGGGPCDPSTETCPGGSGAMGGGM